MPTVSFDLTTSVGEAGRHHVKTDFNQPHRAERIAAPYETLLAI
jgi:hypothetical protein